MLSQYPILFNNTAIPWPDSWDEDYETIETVMETEAGTDQVAVIRSDKLSASASFSCSSLWAGKFKAWSLADAVQVSLYDPAARAYSARLMRIRGYKQKLVRYSEKTPYTQGLWTVSFDLEEF